MHAHTHARTHARTQACTILHHHQSVALSAAAQSGPVPRQAAAMMSTHMSKPSWMTVSQGTVTHCFNWCIHCNECWETVTNPNVTPHRHNVQFTPSPEVPGSQESNKASSHAHDNTLSTMLNDSQCPNLLTVSSHWCCTLSAGWFVPCPSLGYCDCKQ